MVLMNINEDPQVGGIGHVPATTHHPMKEMQTSNQVPQVVGIDHIPTRHIRIKRAATTKHAAQVSVHSTLTRPK